MTLGITTLNPALNIMTRPLQQNTIMTLNIMTLTVTIDSSVKHTNTHHNLITLNIMTLGIMTISIMTVGINNDSQHNDTEQNDNYSYYPLQNDTKCLISTHNNNPRDNCTKMLTRVFQTIPVC